VTARADRPTPARHRRRPALGALAAGLALALAACGGGGDDTAAGDEAAEDESPFVGIPRDPAPDVSAVSLPDAAAAGTPYATVAEEGELLLVFFGFTNCPDICPTTLADVRAARAELAPEDAERVDLAMVTVDPGRDTADVLTGYVRSFVPEGHALRTEDDTALRAAATAFGADYLVETDAAGEVEVGHTSQLYAVDDQGRMVLQWSFGTSAEDIRADVELLLAGDATT
jgi:protein SCO1/2